jgi:2-polyprenyl-3-methyl-5-hydroxy-6-metoxy-1,4-benzoquinol methylase
MPCEWSLQHNGKLLLNGLPVRGSCADLLRPNSWVISQLELSSRRGAKLYRRLRHRLVDYTGQEADERYFTGDNYEDYDVEAAGCSVSILDELERYGEVKSLLDLGCATGILLRHAQQQGIAVAGIDSSAWAVERANAKLGAPVCRVADLDAVRAEDFSSHYDAVVMRNVIEHVRDPKRLVGLAAALLKPGGLVYCQTLNADSLMHNMRRKGWAGYSDYTHQSPWLTARWLRDAFSEAGFDMLRFGIEDWVWNEDTCDEVLREFGWMMSRSLAQQLLRDGWGDVVVLVARKA